MSDKRRRWWWWWLAIAAAIIAAILLLRCAGVGFGGAAADRETADTPAPQSLADPPTSGVPTRRCQIRVDSTGISLAGTHIETADIGARCKVGVELTVTGDARFGDAEAVREAVRAAGIDLLDRSR